LSWRSLTERSQLITEEQQSLTPGTAKLMGMTKKKKKKDKEAIQKQRMQAS